MARVVTVTANPLLDFVTATGLVAGQVNRVDRLDPVAEGKGVNVARLLTRLGHETVCCGFAGGQLGSLFAELVADFGAQSTFTPCAARLRTGFMAAPAGAEHPTTLLEGGFAITAEEVDDLVAAVTTQLASAELVIVSGSVPDPAAAAAYPRIAARCAEAGVPCWIDSYGAGMRAALAGDRAPSLAKPNREEFATCEGWDAVGELHCTDGAGGVSVRRADGAWRVTPPAITQVNPVGSGDCYVAALAHARLSGLDLPDQLRWAAAAGAVNAARADIAAFGAPAIEALLAQVRVERT